MPSTSASMKRPKSEPWDEIQLCAQALCLEEMVGRPVTEGAIYYAARRRRTVGTPSPSATTIQTRPLFIEPTR